MDLDAEHNRMSGPGASAYLEAEHLLARLEALSGTPSIWRTEGHPLYRCCGPGPALPCPALLSALLCCAVSPC